MIFFCQVKAESDVINGSWKPGGDSTGLADSIGEFNKDVNKERGGVQLRRGGVQLRWGGVQLMRKERWEGE